MIEIGKGGCKPKTFKIKFYMYVKTTPKYILIKIPNSQPKNHVLARNPILIKITLSISKYTI